jgi:type VII secretion-associated serine protease mycosin
VRRRSGRGTIAVVVFLVALACAAPAFADPVRDAQWQLGFLNVTEAHKYSQGEGVVVGVIDTGVDASHPDLSGSILAGMDFTGAATNGGVDSDGHGTGMAGLVAAHGRTLGIAPKAKILPVRDRQYGFGAGVPDRAMEWAVDNGARVVCLASAGDDSPDLRRAIQTAATHDVIVVAAIGNEPLAPGTIYPGAYPGVLTAVGVDRNGQHAAVSVTGPQAVLAAPAVDVGSTDIRTAGHTGYRAGTGTSDATAIIAGAAALVRAKFPNLSAAEVIHRLTATADDKGAPGRDEEYGYGIVNLVRALTADVPLLTPSAGTTPTTSVRPEPTDGVSGKTVAVVGGLVLVGLLAVAYATIAVRRRT